MSAVYLDHNATTFLCQEATQAMTEAMARLGGNPSSPHKFGRQARKMVEDARITIAEYMGVTNPTHVIFTSGATEANGLALANSDVTISSPTEHLSVLENAPNILMLEVDSNGRVNLEHLKNLLKATNSHKANHRNVTVAIMAANNETGVLLVEHQRVYDICSEFGAKFHCDMSQWLGKQDGSQGSFKAHSKAISAHKFGGPAGIGALITDPDWVTAQIKGGGQEHKARSGTENTIAICGFAAAIEALRRNENNNEKIKALRDEFEKGLKANHKDVIIFGKGSPRLPNTSCFALPRVSGETMVLSLDLAGFAVSSGSACSSGKINPSHVVMAMGYHEQTARNAVRVSLGATNTAQHIHSVLTLIDRIVAVAPNEKGSEKSSGRKAAF